MMDKIVFYRLASLSFILNLSWAFLSTQMEYAIYRHNENPGGVITACGFILVYALTFYPFVVKEDRNFSTLLLLFVLLGSVFLISTFAIPPLFINSPLKRSDLLATIFSSIFSAVSIVSIFAYYFSFQKKLIAIALTSVAACGAAVAFWAFSNGDNLDSFKHVVHPVALGYSLWQISTSAMIGFFIKKQ